MGEETQGEQRRFGPSAATILATEHWSLLGTRSMIWNEALSRATVLLTLVSAAVVALALVGDATGFDRAFTLSALVLLPGVLFLGVGTFFRLVDINRQDGLLVQAMNRLRHAYLAVEPELAPYFTNGSADDQAGLNASFFLGMPAGADRTAPSATEPRFCGTNSWFRCLSKERSGQRGHGSA